MLIEIMGGREIFPADTNTVRNHTHACCLNRDGGYSKVEVT